MEPLKRRGLSFKTIDLSVHRSHQHGTKSVRTKPSKLVFVMQEIG
jgi:hypothetical protein